MQTRAPIKNPFTLTCGASVERAKGFSGQNSMNVKGIIPDSTVMSILGAGDRQGKKSLHHAKSGGTLKSGGTGTIFSLDHGAGCRYLGNANKKEVAGRHLKTCFFYFLHPIKSFCLENREAVRPLTLLFAFAILKAFLFSGGLIMKDRLEAPSYPLSHTVPTPPPPRAEAEQEATPAQPPVEHFRAFCTYYDNPVDILENAASIISFLEDVTPSMIENDGNLGLSQSGMNGLSIIYQTLGETVRAAVEVSKERDKARDAATGKKEVTA